MIAEEGFHIIYGGYGDDTLISEPKLSPFGADDLTGGAGTDTFVIGHNPNPTVNNRAFIQDFSPGEIIFAKAGGFFTGGVGCTYINRITYDQVFTALGEFEELSVSIILGSGDTNICADGIVNCFTFPYLCVKEAAGSLTMGTADGDWLIDHDGPATSFI